MNKIVWKPLDDNAPKDRVLLESNGDITRRCSWYTKLDGSGFWTYGHLDGFGAFAPLGELFYCEVPIYDGIKS